MFISLNFITAILMKNSMAEMNWRNWFGFNSQKIKEFLLMRLDLWNMIKAFSFLATKYFKITLITTAIFGSAYGNIQYFFVRFVSCAIMRVINVDPSNTMNRKGSRQCSNSPYPPTICTRYIRTWTRKTWFQIDHNGIEFWRMYTTASFARMHHNQLNWSTW